MKKVYTNQNIALAGAMKSYLEENDIASVYRNEFSSSVMGEVPFFDVWPELWVDDHDSEGAIELLKLLQEKQIIGPDWFCKICKESNPSNFEICWQCEKSNADL